MDFASARNQLREKIASVNAAGFESLALEVFRFQARHNVLYRQFLALLRVDPQAVTDWRAIPCLPIALFKTHDIRSGEWEAQTVFTSSGTTGSLNSRHLVCDLDWYLAGARRGFEQFYGDLERYCVLALLPAYLERSGSSLVAMADDFIRTSRYDRSGFFLYNTQELIQVIGSCQKDDIPVLLLGVSFALLDLAEEVGEMDFSGVTVMETGGMKGRRRELTREELHAVLKKAFKLPQIHSEYGMTELFSQAYSQGRGLFRPTATMRVRTREVTDPLTNQQPGRTGAIDIVDLSNLDTLSFIATDDLGKVYEDYSFEVVGRLDNSDIRGCNLMVE